MTEPDEHRPGRHQRRKLAISLIDLVDAYDRLVGTLGAVDPAQWTQAFEVALAELHLPDWQRDFIRDANPVQAGFGVRFIRGPQADSHEGYADMEAFIETVTQDRLAERLSRAIQGRGAFRPFKDVLLDYQDERERCRAAGFAQTAPGTLFPRVQASPSMASIPA